MHITLEADYAVRIVELLAESGEKLGAQAISESTGVPVRFALKILRKLVGGGLVQSFKGAHGGYLLARSPAEITLRQVIEAVEGPFLISRCLQEEYTCDHASCRFHKIYNEVSAMVRDKLDSFTFDQTAGKEDCAKIER